MTSTVSASVVRRALTALAAAVAVTGAALTAAPGIAQAAPGHVTGVEPVGGQMELVYVYSPSMDRVIENVVLVPASGAPAPVYYLLHGVGGGVDHVTWRHSSKYAEFFADEHVLVVSPIGGPGSNYTNWRYDDPVRGPASANQWETYLTEELPEAIDAHFATTGRNAIGGLSMSAGPALDLAIQAPHRYDAVASYSGCGINSGPLGVGQVGAVVASKGGNPFNMWGPPGDPHWLAHDPFTRAGELGGKAIYLSSASGIPGDVDSIANPLHLPGVMIGGGTVEAVSNECTASMSRRLHEVGVPHTFVQRDTGAHTWGLFETDLRHSWNTVLGPALGAK